jgi:hypothetical protein
MKTRVRVSRNDEFPHDAGFRRWTVYVGSQEVFHIVATEAPSWPACVRVVNVNGRVVAYKRIKAEKAR